MTQETEQTALAVAAPRVGVVVVRVLGGRGAVLVVALLVQVDPLVHGSEAAVELALPAIHGVID